MSPSSLKSNSDGFSFLNFNFGAPEAEISLDQNCYQNLVQKHQGHVIPLIFGFRGIVPGTKSSGAHWILALLQNLGNGRETQHIGCTAAVILRFPD